MTKRMQYGLSFKRLNTINGINPFVNQDTKIGNNSALTFLSHLSIDECQSFIGDLNDCITYQTNIDEGFFSDSVEHIDISYNYPNVVIDSLFTISMQDMIGLLQEWITFIS